MASVDVEVQPAATTFPEKETTPEVTKVEETTPTAGTPLAVESPVVSDTKQVVEDEEAKPVPEEIKEECETKEVNLLETVIEEAKAEAEEPAVKASTTDTTEIKEKPIEEEKVEEVHVEKVEE